MFLGMIMMVAVAFLFLLVRFLWFNWKTRKILQKHQAEWNKIKAEMQLAKTSVIEQYEAYFDYCNDLLKKRDATVGACFPRF